METKGIKLTEEILDAALTEEPSWEGAAEAMQKKAANTQSLR